MDLYCLQCIAEAAMDSEHPKFPEGPPVLFDWMKAVTLAPSWQTQMAGPGQVVMACVSIPSCMNHLNFTEKTPQERSLGSGLILPGFGMPDGGRG